MGHQLVALLGGSVERYRVVDLVVGGVGDLLVGAVDAGRRCIDEVLHFVVAACLEYVVEADEIAFDVCVRVGDGIAHTGLCGQVDHYGYAVFAEDLLHCSLVRDGCLHEFPVPAERLYLCEPFALDAYIVVVGHRVDAHHAYVIDIMKQPLDEVAADESGRARHEHRLAAEVYVERYHF